MAERTKASVATRADGGSITATGGIFLRTLTPPGLIRYLRRAT